MFGAIIGDVVGSVYEFSQSPIDYEFELINIDSLYTDDTIMTLAVGEILENNKWKDREYIIKTFKKWGAAYPWAGYGKNFFMWLMTKSTEPYYSCGNGSAMRVSPCALYYGISDS